MTDTRLGVGKIPLEQMCIWLNMRGYNKKQTIEYINKYYDIDIKEIIENKHKQGDIIFDFYTDIVEKFNIETPTSTPDNGTREWFNYYGRKRYIKFLTNYVDTFKDFNKECFDEILDIPFSTDIHHIYALEYSGTNDLRNLISINTEFHNMLHKNPLEHIEKYCFQAMDYLKYLVKWNLMSIVKKNNLHLIEDEEIRFKVINLAIEKEMKLFYEKLLDKYNLINI